MKYTKRTWQCYEKYIYMCGRTVIAGQRLILCDSLLQLAFCILPGGRKSERLCKKWVGSDNTFFHSVSVSHNITLILS